MKFHWNSIDIPRKPHESIGFHEIRQEFAKESALRRVLGPRIYGIYAMDAISGGVHGHGGAQNAWFIVGHPNLKMDDGTMGWPLWLRKPPNLLVDLGEMDLIPGFVSNYWSYVPNGESLIWGFCLGCKFVKLAFRCLQSFAQENQNRDANSLSSIERGREREIYIYTIYIYMHRERER